jgi:hypothetical protein
MPRPITLDPKVIAALKSLGGEASPTQIGLEMGFSHVSASSRVATSLRRLAEAGVIAKKSHADRSITYEIRQN